MCCGHLMHWRFTDLQATVLKEVQEGGAAVVVGLVVLVAGWLAVTIPLPTIWPSTFLASDGRFCLFKGMQTTLVTPDLYRRVLDFQATVLAGFLGYAENPTHEGKAFR